MFWAFALSTRATSCLPAIEPGLQELAHALVVRGLGLLDLGARVGHLGPELLGVRAIQRALRALRELRPLVVGRARLGQEVIPVLFHGGLEHVGPHHFGEALLAHEVAELLVEEHRPERLALRAHDLAEVRVGHELVEHVALEQILHFGIRERHVARGDLGRLVPLRGSNRPHDPVLRRNHAREGGDSQGNGDDDAQSDDDPLGGHLESPLLARRRASRGWWCALVSNGVG
jgi:hypothetical protein